MSRLDSYPHKAGFKVEGTSEIAATTVDAGTLRLAVLVELQANGAMTPDECAVKLGLSVLSIRPRFTELKAGGRIIHIGERRKNRSGRYAEVCAASPCPVTIGEQVRRLADLASSGVAPLRVDWKKAGEELAAFGEKCAPAPKRKKVKGFAGILGRR